MEKIFFRRNVDYTKIKKEYRSNSYIENYNKRIKLKLSEYLFGKSKTKISWPLFNYFIKEEEHDYRIDNINIESSLEIKSSNNQKNNPNRGVPNVPKKTNHFHFFLSEAG